MLSTIAISAGVVAWMTFAIYLILVDFDLPVLAAVSVTKVGVTFMVP